MFQFLRGIALIVGMMSNYGAAFAQMPPTATEAFNLRIRCKEMADKKSENFYLGPVQEILFSAWSSKYDPKNNRCYIRIDVHRRSASFDIEHHQVYDAQTDDLLATADIQNGKKHGMVFDLNHRTTTDENLGWDNAVAYMDEMMADKRN